MSKPAAMDRSVSAAARPCGTARGHRSWQRLTRDGIHVGHSAPVSQSERRGNRATHCTTRACRRAGASVPRGRRQKEGESASQMGVRGGFALACRPRAACPLARRAKRSAVAGDNRKAQFQASHVAAARSITRRRRRPTSPLAPYATQLGLWRDCSASAPPRPALRQRPGPRSRQCGAPATSPQPPATGSSPRRAGASPCRARAAPATTGSAAAGAGCGAPPSGPRCAVASCVRSARCMVRLDA
jgi:hypothetical protein